MRYRALLIVAAGALALAPASAADVTLINISSPVHPGSYASLSVRAASHVACVLRVHYRSERPVFVQSRGGLFAGIIGWRWKMPATARRGVWSADVNCGTQGSLHPKFTVR